MRLIFEEFYEKKNSNASPNRPICYVEINSPTYVQNARTNVNKFDCKIYDCQFQIDKSHTELLEKVISNDDYSFNTCLHYILRMYYSEQNNCCVLAIRRTNSRNKKRISSYGYCKFETCNKFIFIIEQKEDRSYCVTVKREKNEFIHETFKNEKGNLEILQKCGYINGPLRDVYRNKLAEKKVFAVRNEILLKSSTEIIQAGNSEVPSASVMRQIRYETKNSENLDKDPYKEIEEMKNKNKFIANFTRTPFNIYLWNREAIKLSAEQQNSTIYFDASGQTCGHPEEFLNAGRLKRGEALKKFKKVYFYPLIMKINKELIPVGTLITDDHTAKNIGAFLKAFKDVCISLNCWPITKKVMIDFSTGLFSSLCFGLNNMLTLEYMQETYEIMNSTKEMPKDLIILHGCCAHFAKIVSHDINRYSSTKKIQILPFVKKLIQECMALATTLDKWDDIWKWWHNFVILFGSKCQTNEVIEAINTLEGLIETKEIEIKRDKEVKFSESEVVTADSATIYKNSPFYKKAKEISEQSRAIRDKVNAAQNLFYVDGFVDHCTAKYMYNVPFWTNVFGRKLDPNCERGSNQTAEAFFNMLKNLQANGQKHLRPATFIRYIETIIDGGLKKTHENSLGISASSKPIEKKLAKMNSPSTSMSTPRAIVAKRTRQSPTVSTPTSNRKRLYEGDINEKEELEVQEQWGTKKEWKKRTYYNAKRIKEMANLFKDH